MRKLIVGMSRATHGQYVHVATGIDEKRMLGLSRPPSSSSAQAVTEATREGDEPEDMMAGGDCCGDGEEDWDPSLY